VTFGLETLAYASETASLEIPLVVEIPHHLVKLPLQLAFPVEQVHLDPSSSIFCISTGDFETKSLPER
jgi:hypothetical protein